MRHLALAVLLACMLSGTARAGEIPSTGVVPPPPPSTVTTTGEIPTSDRSRPVEIDHRDRIRRMRRQADEQGRRGLRHHRHDQRDLQERYHTPRRRR